MIASIQFQFTFPIWRAMERRWFLWLCITISIHVPRVGSDIIMQMAAEGYLISIHVPRLERDFNLINSTMISLYFNSHSSLRGEWSTFFTCSPEQMHFNSCSLCWEWPGQAHLCCRNLRNFNSHSPHGERLYYDDYRLFSLNFNSYSPYGERSFSIALKIWFTSISIHTSRVGSDQMP